MNDGIGGEWIEKTVLITVKAYPNPSRKYRETVCVAGVSDGKWIRLYPVQFRSLPFDKMFRKYELVRFRVKKHDSDSRPESYRPAQDEITRLAYLDVARDKGWQERKRLILPTASDSMCEILRLQETTGKSLGMFKPQDVHEFKMVKEEDEWSEAERFFQLALFGPNRPPVERLPFSFKYHYRCNDPHCKGHKMKIVDWEAAELYRSLRDKYKLGPREIEEKMRQKWLQQMFSPVRESYFYVGNMKAHPQSFIILGVFWPPKSVGLT